MKHVLALLAFAPAIASADPVTVSIPASPDVEADLKAALAAAVPGEHIILPEGKYSFTDEINIDQAGIELSGQGMEKTVLDFSHQAGGAEGILGSAPGLLLHDFTVQDSPGDAIKVAGVNGVTFRKMKVLWTSDRD